MPPSPETNRYDYVRVLRVLSLIFILALASSALPDSNGNTVAARIATDVGLRILISAHQENGRHTAETLQAISDQTENPYYKPYLELVMEGVLLFRTNEPTTEVSWNISQNYVSEYDLFRILASPITAQEATSSVQFQVGDFFLTKVPNIDDNIRWNEAIALFFNRLPEEVRRSLRDAEDNRFDFPETQLTEQFGEATTSRDGGVAVDYQAIKQYYVGVKDEIENLFKKNSNQPLSQPQLIAFFLSRNQGDLDRAFFEMTGFLKFMIRGRDGIGDVSFQEEWLKKHILDQVNPTFSLNKMPNQETLSDDHQRLVESTWGLVYHHPHIVSILKDVSPSMDVAAVAAEYFRMNHVGEAYKAQTDFILLLQVFDILAYLDSLS